MKAKHTPGPWESRVHDKGPYFSEVEIWHENYGLIARMPDNTSIWNSEKKEDVALEILATTKANAKVMAASTELLEACQAVMSCERGVYLPAEVVVKLGNAIKKATS